MSISVTDYFLLSAVATGAALLAAASLKKPLPSANGSSRETTRWKRFVVSAGAMHKRLTEPCLVVREDPTGLKLLVAPRPSVEDRRWRIIDESGRTIVAIVRSCFFFRRRLRVILHRKSWLEVLLPRAGQKKTAFHFASPTEACEAQGNLLAREFEIRKRGRLVATISWQRQEAEASPASDYVLEVLKGEDPLPMAALVLAIEAALGPPVNPR